MILYTHVLCLLRVAEDHSWEIVSVGEINGTLTAVFTTNRFLKVKWGGVDRYEVDGEDLTVLQEQIEDAHTAHLHKQQPRRRSRSRGIVAQSNPFWEPKKNEMGTAASRSLSGFVGSSFRKKILEKKRSSRRQDMLHNVAQLKMSERLHSKSSLVRMAA